jgi:hypothetical protein
MLRPRNLPTIDDLFVPRPRKDGAFRIDDDVMSHVLNRSTLSDNRNIDRGYYLVHVSDVIKTEQAYAFCAREHVLNYHSTKTRLSRGSLPPGRELLFANGHFLHDHVIKKFLRESPFAQYAYGTWVCMCKSHWSPDFKGRKQTGTYGSLDRDALCEFCGSANDNYVEISVVSRKFHLTGHPDFLLLFEGRFYVYEFKTIDRADIDFDAVTQPFFDHVLQASFYYYIMTELGFKMSPVVRILYVDRSNKKLFAGEPYKEFHRKAVPLKTITEYTDKLKAVAVVKKSRWLPPRICNDIHASRARNCAQCIECFERRGRYATEPVKTRLVA